jgi:photosystem II stability/assembly factor-like uncharacterized protein
VVRGAYYIGDVVQLRDGTMLAGARVSAHYGYWERMPATPLEFAKAAAGRYPEKTVIFRSDDAGETWTEVCRLAGPFLQMDAPYSIFEAPDGTVLMLLAGGPIPMGRGFPEQTGGYPRQISVLQSSKDKGRTWEVVSVIGSNEFDNDEGTAAYLPDGSIGFPTRPAGAWFQSYDHGKIWSEPRRLHGGTARGVEGDAMHLRGDLVVTPDNVCVLVYSNTQGGMGQVIYSRDSGKTWIKPAADRGFQYDPIAYYPSACVLEDGSIFAVGSHEGIANKYGPWGAEVTSMRFRVKSAEEGEGIELLPIGGSTGSESPRSVGRGTR